ncbi:uncharacterized protein LOC117644340 isoform X2 [Thrips palmi]|uniref:Uncharacterized protein LOC117644340 isoform X2 n=1 Tax=Thrips palmi TaxID=161013 RepID=A0A6P8ZLX2_THRPL|nr:uncharacterized protein LOC117644340 isoform X2 [Thrips palmi]
MEKPPRKKKGSSLRVSLGRKSVGDLTALEVSNASSNESCHLNPDSAVIDPDFAANPDWFKHLGPNCSVLVSQDSVNEAILNERDANLVNNSDVEGLNLSKFDRKKINKILNSSVVVNTSEIERLTKRKSLAQSEEVDAELSEEDDISPPKKPRRPTTFKRGTPRDGGKSLVADKAFQAILDHDSESDEETVSPVKTSKTSSVRKSSLFPDSEVSVEIIRKRPKFLLKRKQGTVANDEADLALQNVFKKVMDETTDSESGSDTSKVAVPPTTDENERNNSTSKDTSFEIPRRRPNFLRKSHNKDKRTSRDSYNVFKEVANETSDSVEDTVAVNTVPQELVEPRAGTSPRRSVSAAATPASPKDSDVSLEIHRRRPAFLSKKSKKDFIPSQDLIDKFKNIMDQSTDSEGSHVSKQILSNDANNRSNISKPSAVDDVSVEIPRRRPAFLKKGLKSTRTSLDDHNPFLNVTSGSEEDEVSKENLPSVNHTPEGDTSLPLGAEANNISTVPEVFQTMKKHSLSLKKLHSGNQVDLLSQVVEENTILDSQSNLRPLNQRRMVPDHGHVSRISSIASITENTRSAPLRVSHLSQRERENLPNEEIGVSPSVKETRLSRGKLPSLGNAEQPNISSELGGSMRSNAPSPAASKEQASFKSIISSLRNASMPYVQDVINSPVSSKETSATHSVKRSLLGGSMTSHKILTAQKSGSEYDGNISDASTISLPSNLTLSTVAPRPPSRASESNNRSATRTEEANNSVLPKEASISKSVSKPQQSEADTESPAMTFLNDTGSDSVFSSGISKAQSSSHVHENSNESSWTENPYVSIRSRTESSGEEAEPFDEELSSIEAVNDVGDNVGDDDSFDSLEESINNNNQEKVQHKNESRALPSGSAHHVEEAASPIGGTPTREHANRHSIFSPLSDKKSSSAKSVRPPAPVVTTAASSKTNSIKSQKVHDGDYRQKMRLFMSKWTEEVKNGKHISQPLPPKPDPIVIKKPNPKSVLKPAKKKEVCPYLADYRPPKRVKPKPYVTSKMYKFLEAKLQPKFGLESRIKAEEFVQFLCRTVTSVTTKKSKYHQLVFDLRDKMVSLGLIRTQLQFHVFIEDYLPDSFRVKSIPCYGCPKGPKLDSDDLNVDLSVK